MTSSDDGTELTQGDITIPIDYSGETVKCSVYVNKGGTIYMENCKVGDTDIEYTYGEDKRPKVGTKYSIAVNETATYNFYVLSVNDDDTINLIMDRNICVVNDDGDPIDYANDPNNNYCRYAWFSSSANNSYGPTTAMTAIYNATKKWTNIPAMIMNYTDENNEGTNYGYTSIITTNGITTITGKQGRTSAEQTIGTVQNPLRARLPMKSEVTSAGCNVYQSNNDYGSCPAWLVDDLKYRDVTTWRGVDKYSTNNGNGISAINGYWLLSSSLGVSTSAHFVSYAGVVIDDYVTRDVYFGVRPVITVPSSMLN